MDFQSLGRRDLQFLCKKNGIPANLTNVAMAKALEALETVEGIAEIEEALGIRSLKVNSPELPHTGQKSFTRGVTRGNEPNNQQQQEPTPMPRSHRVTIKTLDVTKMASNEEEIQENLGFQSLNVMSPELPRTARRTSARRAAHPEKPSPLNRSCLKASIDLEEEGEKKKFPHILPNTPATRKAARGVEAQSSRKMVKKKEDAERHSKTPKEVEAKGEKPIGVVTRRSTRLSSRKALEESVTTQSKSKSSGRENSAVKMAALAKEDAGEQEKEEVKKDLVKYGEVENEREATHENVHEIQQETGRLHPLSHRVNTKALEATKMVPKEEDDKEVTTVALIEEKAGEQENEEDKRDLAEKSDSCAVVLVEANKGEDKKEEIHGYSSSEVKNGDSIAPLVEEVEENNQEVENHCFSSSTQVEEDDKEVTIVALIEEKAGEQENEKDKRDLAEKSDSCAVALVEANKEEDKKEEIHDCSSSEVKNGDSIATIVEEVEENTQEAENLCFSSSTQVEDSNIEVKNGDSRVALVEGDGKNNEELEIQVSSFSMEMQDSNVETESDVFNVIHVEEKGRNAQEESQKLSSFCVENSIEHSNDQWLENDLVDDSSNIVPTNEAVEDSSVVALVDANKEENKKEESHGYSSSSEVKKGDSIAPLVEEVEENNQELEILCFSSSTQVEDSNIEVKNGDSTIALVEGEVKKNEELEIQVSSISIEMQDLNVDVVHVEEKGRNDQEESHELSSFCVENSIDQSPENDLVDYSINIVRTNEAVEDSADNSSNAKLVSSALADNLLCSEVTPLPHEEAIQQSSGIKEEARKLSLLFTEMTLKEAKLIFSENVDARTNLGDEACTTEASGEIPGEVMESGGVLTSEISVAIGETIDDDLANAGALSAIDSLNAQGTSFESRNLVSSIELCTDISAADSTIEWPDKDANELPVVIKESFEDIITDSSELTANGFVDVRQKEETLKDYFFKLQIPVSSAELCSEFLTVDSTIEPQSVDHLSENHGESVEDDYLHKLAANESFDVSQKTEFYQSGSFKPQNPVSSTELCFELSTVDSDIDFKESFGNLSSEISALIDESVAAGLSNSDEISSEKSVDGETSQDASFEPQIPVPSPAEVCVEFSTILSPLKLPCASETRPLLQPSIIQTQPCEQAPVATTEKAEENEETMIKASEEVFFKNENFELMSLTKLRAMYKQMVNNPKTEVEKRKSIIKREDIECLSVIKDDENNKQKLNDDITKSEKKRSVIKQQDLECLSRSKLDSNCKQKLNDDEFTKSEKRRSVIKQQDLECLSRSKLLSNSKQKLNDDKFTKSSERKRTPLKNLNCKLEF